VHRRQFLAATAGVALSFPALLSARSDGLAAQWPDRAVRMILPLGPGSGLDITARLFAEGLAAKLGKPVEVDNKPGGDAVVAITEFAKANDDHTLLAAASAMFTPHPYTLAKLPYDPQRDLVPLGGFSRVGTTIAATGGRKLASLADLLALAKAEPGKLKWCAVTSMENLMFAGFLKQNGVEMERVAYTNPVEAVKDLAEGRVDVMLVAAGLVLPLAKEGKVSLLAVANPQRSPALPELPTAAEAGFGGLSFDPIIGLFGPAVMAEDARQTLASALNAVAADPAVAGKLVRGGQLVKFIPAHEFAAAIAKEQEQVAELAKMLGTKPTQ